MHIEEFQDIVSDVLATIYSPTFASLSPIEQQNIVPRVREAYYSLDENTPGSEVDYAASTLWAIQTQYNEVMLASVGRLSA